MGADAVEAYPCLGIANSNNFYSLVRKMKTKMCGQQEER